MKKIVICSSGSMAQEAREWKVKLENKGYNVIQYPQSLGQDILKEYPSVHAEHYKKIKESDILFVLNIDKNDILNYIGPGVFAEIAFAIGLNVSLGYKIEIYTLNPLPENLPYSKELNLWKELEWIKLWKVVQ